MSTTAPADGGGSARRRLSIVVPTYREAENLPHLIDRVAQVKERHGLDVELLIMDDDSQDGSVEAVAARREPWVRIVVRKADRGLSPAVLDGLALATGEVLACMDADLSHPPEALPAMMKKLEEGADFVLGSRYVEGGTTADDWGLFRWLNSRIATALARPLTSVRDPMGGFFVMTRAKFQEGCGLNPIGYKIALELIIKCRCERVVEVPIHFANRRFGESKLTLKQQLLYLQHLRRLYIHKFGVWSQLMQFLVVGAMGTAVNLGALTALDAVRVPVRVAIAAAIWIAMTFNFVLNRRFSFSFARRGSWWQQYVRYTAASLTGALVNYAVTLGVLDSVPRLPVQVAALCGIAVGTGVNFIASRYLVFRATHVRAAPSREPAADRTQGGEETLEERPSPSNPRQPVASRRAPRSAP